MSENALGGYLIRRGRKNTVGDGFPDGKHATERF